MNQESSPNTPADVNNAESAKSAKRMKHIGDALLIGGIALLAVAAALCLFLFRVGGDTVTVEIDGNIFGTYSLSEDVRVEIPSGEGQLNVLVIRDGEAFVESATCPDGICAAHRPVSHDGEQIVCLPHKVVITVQKTDNQVPDDGPDIVA